VTRLIKLSDVSAQVGLATSRIYELRAAGQFPEPIRIGRSVRWSEAEVQAWIQSRLQAREQGA
jgi:prophage regulatory protein